MKKILVAVFASALSLALAVPVASACPGHDSSVAKEKKQDDKKEGEVAKKKGDSTQDKAKETEQKKPVKVSQK